MSTVQTRDAQLQAFMQMYELRAACNDCTHKRSRISYSIITTPHRCSHNLLLVRAKVRCHKWSPVSIRPSYPCPNRYEVCWYFKEDVGCYVHHDRCTFASNPEEAAVWNLQKHINLDHKTLIHLITQRQHLDKQSRQEDGQSRAHEPLSYKEKLLEEYRRSCNEILIISEQVDDVCVTHDENLTLDCLREDSEIRWKFTITTERSLAHVALLKSENGAVFSLSDSLKNTFPPISYIAGHHLRSSHSIYQLSVSFLSFRPGVYEQWLVFDFDIRPVLLRKLKVRVGQQFHVQPDEAEESECAEIFSDERWNRGNRVIVPFFARREEDEQLLSKYKPPQINLQFNPHADHGSPLHRDNYRERAHHFLFREEIAEEELISRLSVCGSVSLSNQLSDGSSQISTAAGKLFATLKVSCLLTPDSPEGLMLKRGVQMALVICVPAKASVSVDHRNHVYEALVLKQAAGEGHIGLHLSAQCVSELQLRKDTRCKMEVQFQLDRLSFCQIHQAIDHLPDLNNVLPDFSKCCVPVNIAKQSELNDKQQIALNFILGKCEVNKVTPPLLMYGPFGTGKTLCLASAAKQLALRSQNKVLICTYTNRRKESAVNNLPAANELVKNIALRHRILKESSEQAVYPYVHMREEPPAGLPQLNESQFKALEKALNSKFTVIQGPPGTGKTVVGAYIVYWFSQLNSKNPWKLKELKDKEKREVILYCGPSNKSVDVVAEYLLKFGQRLKQLRVYSRQMEMLEYPYPGSNLQLSHKSLRQEKSKPELKYYQ